MVLQDTSLASCPQGQSYQFYLRGPPSGCTVGSPSTLLSIGRFSWPKGRPSKSKSGERVMKRKFGTSGDTSLRARNPLCTIWRENTQPFNYDLFESKGIHMPVSINLILIVFNFRHFYYMNTSMFHLTISLGQISIR